MNPNKRSPIKAVCSVRVVDDGCFWFCIEDLHTLFKHELRLDFGGHSLVKALKYFKSLDADGDVNDNAYISQGMLYLSLLCSFGDAETIFSDLLLTACDFFYGDPVGIPVRMKRFVAVTPLYPTSATKESEAQ